jgi:beta-mannosidase
MMTQTSGKLVTILAGALGAAGALFGGAEVAVGLPPVPASVLKADPWVIPPRNAAETKDRLADLRKEYAPYLRSLPSKQDVRKRQSLNGEWRSKVEVQDSDDGVVPPVPEWFAPGLDEMSAGWEAVTVPHWRWSTTRDPTQFFPWYPESKIVWYRKTFEAEAPLPGERVFLNFAGVDWAAEVWFNGVRLGQHSRYWEPFRFEVTDLVRKQNTLAVRLIDGPAFGEAICQWSVLPFSPSDKLPGKKQEFVMGKPDLTAFNLGQASAGGSGYGIHREVTLERTAGAYVAQVFARGYIAPERAKVLVETDSDAPRKVTMKVSLLPENFEGASFVVSKEVQFEQGAGRHELSIPMPDARWWWPNHPHLYRCRVELAEGARLLDVKDALFGVREATLVESPRDGLQEGQLLINRQPVFLRGANLGGANLAWYWGDHERLLDMLLLVKAGNFNAIRNTQHVAFPEVIELFDRLGILNQQEQGTGMQKRSHTLSMEALADVVRPMARVLYNHPSVIFFSFMNETHANMTKPVAAILEEDPERLMVPIAGTLFSLDEPAYARALIGQFHRYDTWYGGIHKLWATGEPRLPGRNVLLDYHNENPNPPATFFPVMRPGRMAICGEYGGEGLDNYETMRQYPPHWGKTPALTDNVVWGFPVNVGWPLNTEWGMRGGKAKDLADYISSSQNHQADLVSEATKGFRISAKAVVGYYLFHLADLTFAHWPKSVVGYDLSPKKAFYAMAQINQPVVPLYRLLDPGNALEIWVSNDLALAFPGCTVNWRIEGRAATYYSAKSAKDASFATKHEPLAAVLKGRIKGDVPAHDAICLGRVDLNQALSPEGDLFELALELMDSKGRKISDYRHELYRNSELMQRSERFMFTKATIAKTWKKRNVALNKPVVASSSLPDAPAGNLVDGQYKTGWKAAGPLPQTLTLDLGQSVKLCGARIAWRGEAVGKVRLEFSEDNRQWGLAPGTLDEADGPWGGSTRMQYFAFEAKTRHVRVTLEAVPSGFHPGLQELEIHESAP